MIQATGKKNLPTWLEVTSEGFSITLKHPTELCHAMVDKVSMRSPTVREVSAAEMASNGDAEKRELMLFSSLTMIPAEDLKGLKYRDYRRLQAGYFRLVDEDEL
ncbi:Phage tail assembly chaperone protein, E, or 41 or 14 [Pseudomonas chlororaphis]|uniref:phage tail assembly protein n=1 Tax=Pseudomonas chlororaphis TaxID=587753 RepID=UPI0039E19369